MNRVCIYPKDIQIITGKSERQCRNIINAIKMKLNKQKHQAITIEEFCTYMGLKPIEVEKYIK
jgi:ribosomal silencing factor RsfS